MFCTIKYYIKEMLEPTILLAPIASVVGMLSADIFYSINIITAILVVIGILLGQISVNVLDDYIDFKKGIDKETKQTKFSGGSVLLKKGLITLEGTLALGIITFAFALLIGVYIFVNHPIILPFLIIGVLSILFYAKYLVRVPFLAEPLMAINYFAVTVGSFAIVANSLNYAITAAIAGASIGILVTTLLVVNEIPDKKADKKHGRKSGVVIINKNEHIRYFYLFWVAIPYILVVIGVILKVMPPVVLSSFILLPFAIMVSNAIKSYKSNKTFERYMGFNVIHAFSFMLVIFFAILTAAL